MGVLSEIANKAYKLGVNTKVKEKIFRLLVENEIDKKSFWGILNEAGKRYEKFRGK